MINNILEDTTDNINRTQDTYSSNSVVNYKKRKQLRQHTRHKRSLLSNIYNSSNNNHHHHSQVQVDNISSTIKLNNQHNCIQTTTNMANYHRDAIQTLMPEASQHCTALSVPATNRRGKKIFTQDSSIKTTMNYQQEYFPSMVSKFNCNSIILSCDQKQIIPNASSIDRSMMSQQKRRQQQQPQLQRRPHYNDQYQRPRHRTAAAASSTALVSSNLPSRNAILAKLIVISMIMLTTASSFIIASDPTIKNVSVSADQQQQLASSSLSAVSAIDASKQPHAEAIHSADQNNVILIKYANVTKQDSTNDNVSDDDQVNSKQKLQQQQLNVFQLYNEPLSVSVIESKFSHSIQLFDVSQNQLPTLSKDLFCPLSNEVRQLNISHNLLENFDCLGLISQAGQLCLSELRILDMSFNLIKHLPATGVATLHNLEVLNLSNNLIESLDELSLSSLFKLTKLDLSFNRIQQLPMRIFHKSNSMKVLRLQSNYLQTNINQMFLSGLISLEEINLSFNNISHVSELAFLEKPNLTRVDLTHNQLNGFRQEALRVTFISQASTAANSRQMQQQQLVFKPRLHHNGQYAGMAPVATSNSQQQRLAAQQQQQQLTATVTNIEFYLSSNPFICDCQLEWMRKFQHLQQQQQQPLASAIRRSVLSTSNSLMSSSASRYSGHYYDPNNDAQLMQNDQPTAATVIQSSSSSDNSAGSSTSSSSASTTNNINAESNQQTSSSNNQQQATSNQQQQQQQQHHYGRIVDLDLIKCTPLFRRNSHRHSNRTLAAPSSGEHYNQHSAGHHSMQVHHPNNHLVHHSSNGNTNNHHISSSQHQMIDLLGADPSNFLCRYKSHCFALCHCCEFDACDCEMICPNGCNCYYDISWQTNIIDCSANNHKVVPDRIPMDVSGLYLDGNNIDSLRPSNLIARRSLKALYLNSSNLQYIANRTFNGLIELQTLYLNDNHLRTLNGYEFEPLAQLKALYLQSNRLDHINNQTFIYLRSLEILDLSNNRLTSMNLALFVSIGHHNIRLRQLSIAHNWWSCQCSSIQNFRQILKQKFLLNGGVQISDRNQLRCYYNSTTVGPMILDGGVGSASPLSNQQQSMFASFLPASIQQFTGSSNRQQQQQKQQQLNEINQCSESLDDSLGSESTDFNPPMIQVPNLGNGNPTMIVNDYPSNSNNNNNNGDGNTNYPQQDPSQQQGRNQQTPISLQQETTGPYQSLSNNPYQSSSRQQQPFYPPQAVDFANGGAIGGGPGMRIPNGGYIDPTGTSAGNVDGGSSSSISTSSSATTIPFTSFLVVLVLFVCMFVIVISVFVFVRQQQRFHKRHQHHNHHHHHHHKKSSAASTTSVSSSASSTAISTAHRNHHHHHLQQHHNHKLAMQAASQQQQQYNTLHHHLIMQAASADGTHVSAMPHSTMATAHHHHSASSQSSNIYAALVSPTNGSSTIVTSSANHHPNNNNPGTTTTTAGPNGIFQQQQQQQNNLHLYSNSSTTASSNSSSQHQQNHLNGQNYRTTTTTNAWQPQQHQQQQQQVFYGQNSSYYGQVNGLENPYAINASNLHTASAPAYHKSVSGAASQSSGNLYNVAGVPPPLPPPPTSSNCHESLTSGYRRGDMNGNGGADWIKLPKVKQFMSRLVNKSLSLGGYRLRDELAAAAAAASMASDKIYDAFLSYDKRDEPFVMQHLAAELEYGQPQFRIADRFRDLPLQGSAYMAEAISSVIGCSQRTILVLSDNYLSSDWCRFELQAALRECQLDPKHRIIVVVLDPKCLLDMDPEMRSLLMLASTSPNSSSTYASSQTTAASLQQQQQQLVQLADSSASSASSSANGSSNNNNANGTNNEQPAAAAQLIATLTRLSGGNQQVCTQTMASKVVFINFNERKFWSKLKQLMPVVRPNVPVVATAATALTLTTKN